MAEDGTTFNAVEFFRLVKDYPDEFAGHLGKAYDRGGGKFVTQFRKRKLSGRPGLVRRSGALSKSLVHRVVGTNIREIDLEISIGGPGVPYARTHEFGRRGRAKRTRYLSIPLDANKDSRGVALAKSPRDQNVRFGGRSAAGNILLRDAASGVPLWVLVERMTIRPRLGLNSQWKKFAPEMIKEINQAVDDTTEQLSG